MIITIPKPCGETLGPFSAEQGGHYCKSCDTCVVNFTQMSDAEILEYLSHHPETNCGIFRKKQLGRKLIPERKPGFSLRYSRWTSTATALLLLFSQANAGSTYYQSTKPETFNSIFPQPGNRQISGRVVFELNGQPAAGAKVVIEGTDFVTFTDTSGYFNFTLGPEWEGKELFLIAEDETGEKGYWKVTADGGQNLFEILIYAEASLDAEGNPELIKLKGNARRENSILPVPSCKINLEGTHYFAITDSFGWFEMVVPRILLTRSHKVTARHQGMEGSAYTHLLDNDNQLLEIILMNLPNSEVPSLIRPEINKNIDPLDIEFGFVIKKLD